MKGRVRWDEANLGEIEANKPERQKITEPKTPYYPIIPDDEEYQQVQHNRPPRSSETDAFKEEPGSLSPIRDSFEYGTSDAMHTEAILSALKNVASSSRGNSHHSGWTTSEDEADDINQDDEDSGSDRSRSFKEQRRVHYDEFQKVKELRRKGSLLEDASDEDVVGEKNSGRSDPSSSLTTGVKEMDIEEGGGATDPQQTSGLADGI
ncbi:unnamed protein product [Ilex paraguariensis]|uniref:Protein phosphatase inhibitor 2 n=1 Tax=Ilex paraguariensis TaxID=185542 RepID=A0ABC8SV86_9AQUA